MKETKTAVKTETKKKFRLDAQIARLLIILIVILLIACITKQGQFASVSSFQTMGKQLAEYGLMALGCGVCMISGGIDLSMVYVSNLTGIVAAEIMIHLGGGAFSIVLALIAGLLVGVICGSLNGFLVSKIGIPAMLATLGVYQLVMGVAMVITGGSTVSGIPTMFTKLSSTNILMIPVPFIIFAAIILFFEFYLRKTKFWHQMTLAGTNMKASRFSGVNNVKVLVRAYMLSGVLSSIAGFLSLARVSSAKANFGTSYTMQCILIAVLGGVDPDGGFGRPLGIGIAVIILQMITSYLNTFASISNYYRDLIWGVALIIVMIISYHFDKKRSR